MRKSGSRFSTNLWKVLLVWFLTISVVPLLLSLFIIFFQSRSYLNIAANNSLDAVMQLKANHINMYFNDLLKDLYRECTSEEILNFLNALTEDLEASGKPPESYVGSDDWEHVVHKMAGRLEEIQKAIGNYDILLLDKEGNVLFSILRLPDLGENILKGQFADSNLAAACRRVLEFGEPAFSDFDFYEPMNEEPSGFVVDLILNKNGDKAGLLAFQVPVGEVDAILQESSGLGQTGESYLIGEDLILRSNLGGIQGSTLLSRIIDTRQSRLWLEATAIHREEKATFATYPGPRGQTVIGSFRDMELAGVRLGIISEITVNEAYAPSHMLGRSLFIVLIITAIFVVFIAVRVSILVTKPLAALSSAAQGIEQGDYSQKISIPSQNEIGELADAFSNMQEALGERTMELVKAKESAEAANRAKSTFLATMSHEIRTPMNAVLGFTQILQMDSSLNSKQLGHLDIIQHGGQYLLDILNDLIDMSRIESGRMTLRPRKCNLYSILDDIEEMFRFQILDKGLQFSIEKSPDTPETVTMDSGKIYRVLSYLIGNAVKFTDQGQILLRVTMPRKNTIHFEIEDSGIGVSENEQEKIFKTFEQIRTCKQSLEGTGLGLSISQRMVRLHGGEITVKSKKGKGSTFSFYIDVSKSDKQAET